MIKQKIIEGLNYGKQKRSFFVLVFLTCFVCPYFLFDNSVIGGNFLPSMVQYTTEAYKGCCGDKGK